MSDLRKNIIGVLVVLALVLGFYIYRKNHPAPAGANNPKTENTSSVSDEKKLLNLPPPNATQDEVNQHSQLAAKLAVIGTQIEIANCQPKPLVLQVQQGANFQVKNSGTTNLKLTFDNDHISQVNAGKTITVKASFDHGQGLYGYRCTSDTTNAITGFVLVAP